MAGNAGKTAPRKTHDRRKTATRTPPAKTTTTKAEGAKAATKKAVAKKAATKKVAAKKVPARTPTPMDLNSYLYTPAAMPAGRARVDFRHHDRLNTIDEPMRGDISGMAVDGETLWLVSDETCSVERLTRLKDGSFGRHRTFDLAAIFKLPGDTEIDLEGMAVEDRWIWLVGSHALKRKKPRPERDGTRKTIKRLGRIEREENRYFLARVPLQSGADGADELVAESDDGRRAGLVRMKKGENDLAKLLRNDPHIGSFFDIPAKENGIDIEGIAVSGNRVFLGLRGPVLRGMAMMIELEVKDGGDGRLKLRKAFGKKDRYRLHFLDLGGMGVRDMVMDGGRLLMLIGPTMDLDGPVAVVGLKEPFRELHDVTFSTELEQVIRIPHGAGTDHAEGLALTPERDLLVAYDSPDPSRLHDGGQGKDLDRFTLD